MFIFFIFFLNAASLSRNKNSLSGRLCTPNFISGNLSSVFPSLGATASIYILAESLI